MRYLSVCSGIEAATVAWHTLGWTAAAFSEIEAFPRAVLSHHYPDTPLHGDFTTIGADEYGPIDLLVGGTPCQSFSVAGLRGGLADERGNLSLEYIRLARRKRARWVGWENVPGVFSSNGGRDFQCFLSGLVGWLVPIPEGGWQNSGIISAGPADSAYGVAWAVLDAQYFGVPQRRRRVILVGHLGDWRRAAAVLFERHSLSGHPAPRREKGQSAPTIPSRSSAGGGLGTDFDCDGGLVQDWPADVCPTLDTYYGDKMGLEDQHVFNQRGGKFVPATYALQSVNTPREKKQNGIGVNEEGVMYSLTARDQHAVAFAQNQRDELRTRDVAGALAAEPGMKQQTYICFSAQMSGTQASGGKDDLVPSLQAKNPMAVAFGLATSVTPKFGHEVSPTLTQPSPSGGGQPAAVCSGSAVRRLTPRECERLQGFPDDYTLIPYRGKPAADGPRYKALGNSMAVPVMRWIGERIQLVETMSEQRKAA